MGALGTRCDTRADQSVGSPGHTLWADNYTTALNNFVLHRFENRFRNLQNIFSKWSNRNVFSFNLKTFASIDWNDDTSTSTCVYVKSVISDGDVEIYSQLSLQNTQKLDMLYTSLLKCICIIFTNQNTHNIFYYKTLGNITFEICNLRGHTCIYHQHKTSEALH